MRFETLVYEADEIKLVGDLYHAQAAAGTVLLLHGGGQTRHSWDRTASRLAAAGWNAHTLDARGHGDSGWSPDRAYSQDRFVADLQAVVASIGSRPVLVGASLGGLTAILAAGESRVPARALVLVDIAARVEPVGHARITDFMRSRPDGYASLDEVAAALASLNVHRRRPLNLDGLRKNVRRHADGRWRWHWDPNFLGTGDETHGLIPRERLLRAARQITIPTLLVHGAQSDVLGAAGIEEMLELIPAARYVRVSDTGHMIAGDDNDAFTTCLLEFLGGLPTDSEIQSEPSR